MRVRISYSVDIDEVPGEASELGFTAVTRIKNIVETELIPVLNELIKKNANYELISDKLDYVRKELANADSTLSDVHAIVLGLDKYHKGEHNVPERRPTMDPTGSDVAPQENID